MPLSIILMDQELCNSWRNTERWEYVWVNTMNLRAEHTWQGLCSTVHTFTSIQEDGRTFMARVKLLVEGQLCARGTCASLVLAPLPAPLTTDCIQFSVPGRWWTWRRPHQLLLLTASWFTGRWTVMAVPPPPGRRRGRGRKASPLRGWAVLRTTPRPFAPLYTPDLSTVVVLKESLPSHPTARWSLHHAPTEPPQRAGKAGMCKLRQSKLACMGREK